MATPPPAHRPPGPRGRGREIHTLDAFDAVTTRSGSLAGYRVQSVDLADRTRALLATPTAGTVFLGCPMTPEAAAKVRADGALLFPPVPHLPFDPYRAALYSPGGLYEGLAAHGYEGTPDALAHAWFRRTRADGDILASMIRSIHDDAVSDALDELLEGARVVGVMGGHATARDSTAYAGAARLGRTLARAGLTVATGGGPGAMEAANLGACLAPHPDSALDEALVPLAAAPSYLPSVTEWALAAFRVRERFTRLGPSVGIPTWFYGHEPPNAFAAHIAKYFANATREDGLLARSTAGIVFLPGAAGTVQEIFDNATPNYYGSRGAPTPMVLVGHDHWTRALPVWPLLRALAEDRPMEHRIALVDSVDEAAAALRGLGGP
ncbi:MULTISPECIES: LOG family protein [unclassified Streptomyces]|uniref:LOG family protein n=1 Tax=unclassified Streptomyces TaxID=2593676 RepID=UPI0016610FCA|nr:MULTISPECIES: LOG family protein [unclassified Streptomyces]MBD0711335.1 Rossmann fold nucleotide-binding protein [Streptomyces sp. CBMA291]MBD0714890.1 Rossmann fold nucleotide-binding protein [Streptomyces sp. CBMA370]